MGLLAIFCCVLFGLVGVAAGAALAARTVPVPAVPKFHEKVGETRSRVLVTVDANGKKYVTFVHGGETYMMRFYERKPEMIDSNSNG